MNFQILLLLTASLIGCTSKSETGNYPERYLYFTSKFPSGISWDIVTSFTGTSNMPWCKDLSMGEGGMIHSTKTVHSVLNKSGDTLKVPLFFPKPNICGKRLHSLYLDPTGGNIQMRQLSLADKLEPKHGSNETKPIPDSLVYLCKKDSVTGDFNCEPDPPNHEFEYLLSDSTQINYFRIDLKGI